MLMCKTETSLSFGAMYPHDRDEWCTLYASSVSFWDDTECVRGEREERKEWGTGGDGEEKEVRDKEVGMGVCVELSLGQ